MNPHLIALFLLFFLDAFFSAAEIAMTALSRFKLEQIAEKHPAYAPLLHRFQANPSRLLTTIIISSNLTVIAFSSVATAFSLSIASHNEALSLAGQMLSVLVSVVTVLVAEIAPKIVAKRHPERVATIVLPGLRLAELILGPLVRLIVAFIGWLTAPFGGAEVTDLPVVTEEELVRLVDEGARGGVIEKEESEMIQSVLEFGDTVVSEVMVPRTGMDAIQTGATVEECLDKFIDCGYSRLPVYDGNFDQIKGFLYAKDFLAVLKERELIILQDVIRPAYFVPETKKVADLLREFKKGHVHIAIVVDEFGGTAGMVTMEDLVEEIVGEIQDEYDFEGNPLRKAAEGVWDVEASAELEPFSRELDVVVPEDADYSTVAGLISEIYGKIPRPGEKREWNGFEIEVLKSSATVVERVRFRRKAGTEAAGG